MSLALPLWLSDPSCLRATSAPSYELAAACTTAAATPIAASAPPIAAAAAAAAAAKAEAGAEAETGTAEDEAEAAGAVCVSVSLEKAASTDTATGMATGMAAEEGGEAAMAAEATEPREAELPLALTEDELLAFESVHQQLRRAGFAWRRAAKTFEASTRRMLRLHGMRAPPYYPGFLLPAARAAAIFGKYYAAVTAACAATNAHAHAARAFTPLATALAAADDDLAAAAVAVAAVAAPALAALAAARAAIAPSLAALLAAAFAAVTAVSTVVTDASHAALDSLAPSHGADAAEHGHDEGGSYARGADRYIDDSNAAPCGDGGCGGGVGFEGRGGTDGSYVSLDAQLGDEIDETDEINERTPHRSELRRVPTPRRTLTRRRVLGGLRGKCEACVRKVKTPRAYVPVGIA